MALDSLIDAYKKKNKQAYNDAKKDATGSPYSPAQQAARIRIREFMNTKGAPAGNGGSGVDQAIYDGLLGNSKFFQSGGGGGGGGEYWGGGGGGGGRGRSYSSKTYGNNAEARQRVSRVQAAIPNRGYGGPRLRALDTSRGENPDRPPGGQPGNGGGIPTAPGTPVPPGTPPTPQVPGTPGAPPVPQVPGATGVTADAYTSPGADMIAENPSIYLSDYVRNKFGANSDGTQRLLQPYADDAEAMFMLTQNGDIRAGEKQDFVNFMNDYLTKMTTPGQYVDGEALLRNLYGAPSGSALNALTTGGTPQENVDATLGLTRAGLNRSMHPGVAAAISNWLDLRSREYLGNQARGGTGDFRDFVRTLPGMGTLTG